MTTDNDDERTSPGGELPDELPEVPPEDATRPGDALPAIAQPPAEIDELADWGEFALPCAEGEGEGRGAFSPATDPGIQPAAPPLPSPAEAAAEEAMEVSPVRLPSILESLLLAADRPLTVIDLARLVGEPQLSTIEAALVRLETDYVGRGVQLQPIAGGWQFCTDPINARWVHRMLAHKPVRLTRAQLEALAIVSYRQPITRPEIDEIRGVDSGGTLKTLLDRSLIRILGKKEEPGRPMLYGTTRDFLEFFHLKDLKDLPTLREFHELSGEHQAEVAALEAAAPPGTIEGQPLSASLPLERVNLPDAGLEEDLAGIDELIDSASKKAAAVEKAMAPAPEPAAAAGPETETKS